MSPDPRRRQVPTGAASLAVYEHGRQAPGRPTVVLLHGWPDRAALWDPVAARLAEGHHVVTYDVRGVGASAPATGPDPYALPALADDLRAVVDAVSPGRPVHLVGHDWGGVQGWEYAATPEHAGTLASFTCLSGPNLDHLGHRARELVRRPSRDLLATVVAQGVRSTYTVLLSTPGLSHAMWRAGAARVLAWWLRTGEGLRSHPPYPGPELGHDAAASVGLYRTNIWSRLRRPRPRPVHAPVQLVVATRDRYVSPRSFDGLERWVPDLVRNELAAGHWAPRTHPDEVADLIARHVDAVERRGRQGGAADMASSAGGPIR